MSLAEPRRRRKNPMHSMNLSAPNHWTNDDSKFGQRMLEKFGWSKGSGLGKNEQGISEIIIVQPKVTPTGLGFIANNADDWFKAGEEYSRLLSQLTEKFDQYQALPDSNENITSKKSLEKNSLNSKSRVHYHKFTKGKDLTQYKTEELACILGKGLKDDDQSPKGLDMNTYFKTKRESKKINVDKHSSLDNKDSIIINDDQSDELINTEEETGTNFNNEHKVNIIPKKKKKHSKNIEFVLPNEVNDVELKRKKKKSKTLSSKNVEPTEEKITKVSINKNGEELDKKINKTIDEKIVGDIKLSKKKKIKLLCDDSVNISECNSYNEETLLEQKSNLAMSDKYQCLVDLLIGNSSAGKKYSKDLSSSQFEKKVEEFVNNVKFKYSNADDSVESNSSNIVLPSIEPNNLNPDDKNFIENFETQKSKLLEIKSNRQVGAKYVDEKSQFIAEHGDILFFGSNINDIKGYGEM